MTNEKVWLVEEANRAGNRDLQRVERDAPMDRRGGQHQVKRRRFSRDWTLQFVPAIPMQTLMNWGILAVPSAALWAWAFHWLGWW